MEATALLHFLLLVALPGSLSNPLNWDFQNDATSFGDQCADHCTASNKFLYLSGHTYRYKYEVTTATSLHGSNGDEAKIDVTATANIRVISKCEMVLSLSDAVVKHYDPDLNLMDTVDDWTFKIALERNQLRFSFQDGRVENLCPSERDSQDSINFKRGVLTAFQSSMSQHQHPETINELDVTGSCPTQYSVQQQGWQSTQLEKVKDLLGCSDRYRSTSALQATPFRAPDTIQSLPLLKGDHKCTQEVTKQSSQTFLGSSSCVETLVFRPFSKKESGARTMTIQKLTFERSSKNDNVRAGSVSERTDLLFQHSLADNGNEQTLYATKEKLEEICRVTYQDIPANVPDLFTDMVYLMRRLTDRQFMDIAKTMENTCANNKERAKKFLYDALPMVGTPASVHVMVELLLSSEVSGVEAQLWLKSLHFLPNPTEDMVAHAKRLLMSDALRMDSLLPVSTLVSHFCKSEPDCSANSNVQAIVNVLKDELSGDCQASEEDLVLMVLRAIGNLGVSDGAAGNLAACSLNDALPTVIRVTALEAYRGVTCDVDRNTAMTIFLNSEEDAEVRIMAYLALMKCADEDVLDKVKTQLENEEVNQVGSFVWSHLSNLQETSSLHKQAIRNILEDEQLKKTFDLDKRKYSRNYEVSYFSRDFGVGSTAEGNLIWSESSFLPRSAMVNLTVDVLGHSVNLLEVGGRVQGLESILYDTFGTSENFKGGSPAQKGSPSKCTKQQKMRRMKEKFAKKEDDIGASVYLRLFGEEFGFKNFDDKELRSLYKNFGGDVIDMMAKGRDVSWTQSALFMDSTVHFPTVAGMSLSLAINASATMDIRASGRMDLQELSVNRMVAKFDLSPSGAIQFSGRMGLALGSVTAGLKMVTTLHTSTAVTGSLELANGQVLTVELDTPRRNMDILNVRSEFYIQHDKTDRSLSVNSARQEFRRTCSSRQFLQVLGYQACAESSYVPSSQEDDSPYFPFTGPTTLSVTVQKKDAPKGFKFIGKHIQNNVSAIGLLSLDTPSSQADRELKAGFSVDLDAHSAELEVTSPWTKVKAIGSYTNTKNSMRFDGMVSYDKGRHSLSITGKKSKKKGKTTWSGTLDMERPENSQLMTHVPSKFSVTGQLTSDDKNFNAEMTINTGLKPSRIDLNADFLRTARESTLAGKATIDSKQVYASTFKMGHTSSRNGASMKFEPLVLISAPKWRVFLLSGQVDYRKSRHIKTDLQINMDKTIKRPIKLDAKLSKQPKKTLNRYRGNIKLNSEFAFIKTSGWANVQSKKTTKVSSRIVTDYKLPFLQDPKEQRNKVILSTKFHDRSTKVLTRYDLNLNYENNGNPESNFASELQLNHKNVFSKASATLRHGPQSKKKKDKSKEIKAQFAVNHKVEVNDTEVVYNALFIYPERAIEYEIRGKHEHHLIKKPRLETYVTAVYGKGKSVEVRLTGNDRTKNGRPDMVGGLEMSFPSFPGEGGNRIPAQKYALTTTLKQSTNDDYVHTVNFQKDNQKKHSIVTRVNAKSEKNVMFTSKIDLALKEKTSVSLSYTKKDQKIESAITFKAGVYKGEVQSVNSDSYSDNSWDITVPERRVKGFIKGGKKNAKESNLDFSAQWDANRDLSKSIDGNLFYAYEEGKRYESRFTVTTPFEGHRIYTYNRLSKLTENEFRDELEYVWKEQVNRLAYNISAELPITAHKAQMAMIVETPHDVFRRGNIEIVHKWDGSKYLSTRVKTGFNEGNIEVALLGSSNSNAVRNKVSGSLTIKSTLPEVRIFVLELDHDDDGLVYTSQLNYNRNNRKYMFKMNATYLRVQYQMTVDSKLEMYTPADGPYEGLSGDPAIVTWVHSNTLTNLNSTLALIWSPEYSANLTVGAKGSKAEKDYALDVLFTAPGLDPKEIELQLRQNNNFGYHGSAFWRLKKDPSVRLSMVDRVNGGAEGATVVYSYTDQKFSVGYKGAGLSSDVTTQYGQLPYTVVVKTIWPHETRGPDRTIFFEGSVNGEDGWSTNAKLVTPWESVKNVDFTGTVKQSSETRWEIDSLISLGVRQEISADIDVETDGSVIKGLIITPFEQMSKVAFSWDHSEKGKTYSSAAKLEVVPIFDEVIVEHSSTITDSKMKSRVFLGLPDLEIKSLEINADSSRHRRGYNNALKVNYQDGQEIGLKVKTRYNAKKFPDKSKLVVELSTPFPQFPSLEVKAGLEKKAGKWEGGFDLKSGVKALEELGVEFTHSNSETSSYTDVVITSSVLETVTAGAHFDWGSTASANLTFDASSVGRTSLGFMRRSQTWLDFHNKLFADFDGDVVDLEIGFKHEEDETRGKLVYSLPITEHSDCKAEIHRMGDSFMDFDVGAFFQLGRNSKPYNVSAQFAAQPGKKYALGTTVETPMTKHFSYLGEFGMAKDNTTSTIVYGKYGRKFLIDVKSSQRLSHTDYEHSTQISYRLGQRSLRLGSDAEADWSDESLQTATVTTYYNDDVVSVDFTRALEPGFLTDGSGRLDVSVKTSYTNFTDVGLHLNMDSFKDGAQHEGELQLEYMDNQEAELTFDITIPNKDRASLTAVLTLPINDYRRNKLTYNHLLRNDRITADAELVTGKGQRLAGDLEYKNREFVFNLRGPLETLESVLINGKFDEEHRKMSGEASYRLRTDPGPLVLKYDIALQEKPLVFDLKLTNRAGKSITLYLEHEGDDWRQFKNLVYLKGQAASLADVNLESNWRFVSPTEFNLRSDLKTSLDEARNAELVFSTSKVYGKQVSDLEFSWAENNKITTSTSWFVSSYSDGSVAHISTAITTPWKELDNANLVFNHNLDRRGLSQEIQVDHNSQNMLDANIKYSNDRGRHYATVKFEKPRPMIFSAEGTASRDAFDGKVNLDWDKNSQVGRVEITTDFSDRSKGGDVNTSFKLKVNHPVRILGVECLHKKGQNEFRSSGLVTWDEERGNTFSYDFGMANRTTSYSQMLEGQWKLGVPQRSVKYTGSYSESGRTVTTRSEFYWHADQDETKKVTMTTNVEESGNLKKIGMNINVPTINKQLNLGATTKGGYGKHLLDTKAEISYSSDPKKTITLTSLISNSEPEGSSQGYNYTMELGFKHPVSGIDLMLLSHLADLNQITSLGSSVSFSDVNGRKQSVGFFSKTDFSRKRFFFTASSPIKSLGFQARVRNGNQARTLVSMIAFEDGEEALKVGMVVDPKRRHMDLEFNYDPDDQGKLLSLSGGYINDSAISLELTSQTGPESAAEIETLVALTLRSAQLLHTRVSWRPYVDEDIKEYLGTKLTAFSYATDDFLQQAVQMLGQEVKAKYTLVSEELNTELDQVFKLMEQEMNSFNGQLDQLWTTVRRFHQQNRMYIRDVGEQLDLALEEINDGLVIIVHNYRNYYNQVTMATSEWMEHLRNYPVAQVYQNAVREVGMGLKEIETALEELLDIVLVEVTGVIDEYYKEYLKLSRNIDRKLNSYSRSIQELPLYRKMVEQREAFGEVVPDWVAWYDDFYIRIQEILQEKFHDFMAREEFQHMFAVANEVLGQVKHYHLEGTPSEALERIAETSKNLMLMEIAKLKKSIMDFRNSRLIQYDPAKGELEFEVYVPLEMKSLSELPELRPRRYIAQARKMVQTHLKSLQKLLPASNESVWDMYHDYLPMMQPRNWVPPFESSAYLIGSQHYITFDNHEFDYLSTCSHVLSRDVQEDLFSVVVNYARRAKRDGVESMCFTVGDLSFDISDDYKLQVNNRETEMPFVTDEVKIVREGDFIRVTYTRGLEVLLNPNLDLYKVTASGWYHGRLAGLMGRFDNEQHNDRFQQELAEDFEVNRRKCNKNNLAVIPQENDKDNVCAALFDVQGSIFEPCFRQVNPAAFHSLCQVYLGRMSPEKALHLAGEQYRHVCEDRGILLNTEGLAVCEAETQPSTDSADVVFLVEDKPCNNWAHTLAAAATNMNQALENRGMMNNRFGLASYGGVAFEQMGTHTVDGQHFGESGRFLRALETLKFSDGNENTDLANVLREVITMPYRANVTKVLVIAPCTTCKIGLLDRGVTSLLKSHGFQVHVLQDKGYAEVDYRVFGANKERWLTNDRYGRDDSRLNTTSKGSGDFCQQLAFQTDGSVFDTAHLFKDASEQRKFIDTFSASVAMSAQKPDCLECLCDAETGRTKCTVCGQSQTYIPRLPTWRQAKEGLYETERMLMKHVGGVFA